MTERFNRALVQSLISLLLLFTQQGALLHAVTHVGSASSTAQFSDKHIPSGHGCALCVAYSVGGCALKSADMVDVPPQPRAHTPAPNNFIAAATRLRYYSTRAPPFLI